MRWVATMAADAYRILMRGGVYLYPGDQREGYANGRLHLLYEANPIAFIIEQAGGEATDGVRRILDLEPPSIHARTPLIFGSKDKIAHVRAYFDEGGYPAGRSPLFKRRGSAAELSEDSRAMSEKHPIIAITGSSGAGTTSVKKVFEQIFRREKIDAVYIEGDSFHRYDRAEMRAKMAEAGEAGNHSLQPLRPGGQPFRASSRRPSPPIP